MLGLLGKDFKQGSEGDKILGANLEGLASTGGSGSAYLELLAIQPEAFWDALCCWYSASTEDDSVKATSLIISCTSLSRMTVRNVSCVL